MSAFKLTAFEMGGTGEREGERGKGKEGNGMGGGMTLKEIHGFLDFLFMMEENKFSKVRLNDDGGLLLEVLKQGATEPCLRPL